MPVHLEVFPIAINEEEKLLAWKRMGQGGRPTPGEPRHASSKYVNCFHGSFNRQFYDTKMLPKSHFRMQVKSAIQQSFLSLKTTH